MPLLAYNLTNASITLVRGNPWPPTLPAITPGLSVGPPFDVTLYLTGLGASDYDALQAQSGVRYEWTQEPEFATPGLFVRTATSDKVMNVQWFGAVAYETTTEAVAGSDSLGAFQAAILALEDPFDPYGRVGTLFVPRGSYRMADTLRVTRPVNIVGEGKNQGSTLIFTNTSARTSTAWSAGWAVSAGTLVHPTASDTWCFIAINAGTAGAVEPVWPTAPLDYGEQVLDNGITWKNIGKNFHNGVEFVGSSEVAGASTNFSKLESVAIQALNLSSNIGVRVSSAKITCRDVFVANWGLHGRVVDGQSGNQAMDSNSWVMDNCSSWSCGGAALFIRGEDANAGCSLGDDCLSCNSGIIDHSFLGNFHFGFHVEDTPSYPVWTVDGGVQHCVFVGYSESRLGPLITSGNTYIGVSYREFQGGTKSGFGFISGNGQDIFPIVVGHQTGASPNGVRTYIGGDPGNEPNGVAIGFAPADPSLFGLSYGLVLDSDSGLWRFRQRGSTNDIFIPFDIIQTKNERSGARFAAPYLLIGPTTNRRAFTTSQGGPPTRPDRYWTGDVFVEPSPAADGAKLYVVTSSTPPYGGGIPSGFIWTAGTGMENYTLIEPTVPNGFCYETRDGGTTGTAEPVWPLVPGATVVDGTVTWMNIGTSTPEFTPIGISTLRTAASPVTVSGTDRFVGVPGVGARTVDLPAAATFPKGHELVVQEIGGDGGDGGVVTIAPAGTDSINGANAPVEISLAFGRKMFYSDGASNWYVNSVTI